MKKEEKQLETQYIIMNGDESVIVTQEEFEAHQAKLEETKQERLEVIVANTKRLVELQDKSILEGLTDTEKAEYKKLRGL